jgi:polysaccharide biosynthesis protein PslH
VKVLLISTVSPYPKNVGKKVVLGGFCDYLSKICSSGNFEIMCFEPTDLGPDIKVSILNKPGIFKKILNLFFLSIIGRKKSFQESLFWSKGALRDINNKIVDFRPDIVIFDTIRTGQYLSGINKKAFKSIIYLEDLFSVRYRRTLETIEKFPNADVDAIGNFSRNIPYIFLSMYQSSKIIKRIILKIERRLVEKSEYTMPSNFDLALLISEDEVRHIRLHTKIDNVFPVRPMLDINRKKIEERSWSGQPEFVFLGSLNLAHNGFSIENFIEQHMAEMISAVPGILLRIIGKHPSEKLLQLANKYKDNVVVEGFVIDLDTTLLRCAAMIVPLVFGSGVKIKMIDAVRLGIPIVSTSFGVEGISTKTHDGGIIIENNLSNFSKICQILLDPEINKYHSDCSRLIYESEYSEDAVRKQYEGFFVV